MPPGGGRGRPFRPPLESHPVRGTLLAIALLVFAGAAGAVEVVELEVPSAHVPPAVRAVVLLPPSYAKEPARRFPVLYFLHDSQGDERTLVTRGVAGQMEAAMRAGTLPEVLVVAPRGSGSWYVDSWDGKVRYARFLAEELVPAVDARFRTVAERRGRAAMGISMGGYGALRWGFARPDDLAVVGGLSPAVQQLDWRGVETIPFYIRPMVTNVFGRGPKASGLVENDLYDMLLSHPERARRAPEVLVRCGTEDRYRLGEVSPFFGKFLAATGVRNEVIVEPGGHDWTYWRRAFPALVRAVLGRLAP